jgi:hypothetical protein
MHLHVFVGQFRAQWAHYATVFSNAGFTTVTMTNGRAQENGYLGFVSLCVLTSDRTNSQLYTVLNRLVEATSDNRPLVALHTTYCIDMY